MIQKLFYLVFLFTFLSVSGQTGIGTLTPDPSSVLDVSSANKGFLAPRISLSSINDGSIDGANTNAVGLMVFNTNSALTDGNGIGYYYWNGTAWLKMTTEENITEDWTLNGNNINSTHFLGSLNHEPLKIQTNNVHRFSFTPNGQLEFLNGGIEIGTSSNSSSLSAIAIGDNANASNESSIALGYHTRAEGLESVTLGSRSLTNGEKSVAVGAFAQGLATNAIALGNEAYVNKINATAIGAKTRAEGDYSIAFGYQSYSSAIDAIALGSISDAQGEKSIALGYDTYTNKIGAIAIGNHAESTGNNAIAIGTNTTAPNPNTIVLGKHDNPDVKVGIGTNAPSAKLQVNGTLRYVDGNQSAGKVLTSDATGNASWQNVSTNGNSPSLTGWSLTGNDLNGVANDGSTFLGTTSYHDLYLKLNNNQIGRFQPNGGIALGSGATSSANQAFAFGEKSTASNTSNYAFGKAANSSGSDSYAIGQESISSQNQSYAFGKAAHASGSSSYAIGESAKASATGSYAIGAGADSKAMGAFAIGNGAISSSNNTLALGNESKATGQNATALGYQAVSTHQNAIAIGPATTALDNTIILGNTISTSKDFYLATKVGIGTNMPSAKLHVTNSFRYEDGNEGMGKVLTSDAKGNTSWQGATYAEIYKKLEKQSLQENNSVKVNFGTTRTSSNVQVSVDKLIPQVSGLYKVTFSINVERLINNHEEGGGLEFYLGRYSNKIEATSSYLTLSNKEMGTVTKTHFINFNAGSNEPIEVYAKSAGKGYQIIEGSTLNLELLK